VLKLHVTETYFSESQYASHYITCFLSLICEFHFENYVIIRSHKISVFTNITIRYVIQSVHLTLFPLTPESIFFDLYQYLRQHYNTLTRYIEEENDFSSVRHNGIYTKYTYFLLALNSRYCSSVFNNSDSVTDRDREQENKT